MGKWMPVKAVALSTVPGKMACNMATQFILHNFLNLANPTLGLA